MRVRHLLTILILLFYSAVFAQENGTIEGFVFDENHNPLTGANIAIVTTGKGTSSDSKGFYSMEVIANKRYLIEISYLGKEPQIRDVYVLANKVIQLNFLLVEKGLTVDSIVVESRSINNMKSLKPIDIGQLPVFQFERLLPSMGVGVRKNSELGSGYSVRGGNFDENLIYVNDIEIYRPFLARAGQQEGLSFINSSLIENIYFSAGGFEAKYGDKLSSVLDIKYRKPTEFKGSALMSLLGGSTHIEGVSKNERLSHITGFRYRTNQYVLNSLQTKGDYKPSFMDLQSLVRYDISENFELSFLGHYSNNKYRFVPQNRETSFGSIQTVINFRVFFDGQEITQFETFTGALSAKITPNKNTELKFITSAFRSFESENYDVQGQYWLDEIEIDLGSEDFGESKFNLGVGTFLNHSRNELDATVLNLYHKGFSKHPNGITHWGMKVQKEVINDRISEWNMIDSAGFSLPNNTNLIGYNNPIELFYNLKTNINVKSERVTAYFQNTWSYNYDKNIEMNDTSFYSSSNLNFTIGGRGNYWTYNNQTVVSPRARISFKPHWNTFKNDSLIRRNILLRFSTGYYYQPPFYREIRDLNGQINPDIKAQQSIHFVVGTDYYFYMWKRPFKLVLEGYYKHLSSLNTYEIDNVRIRYYANNNAKGYATGVDLKINGEFVEGVESWLTLSYLKTEEDISDDSYLEYYNAAGETIKPGITIDDSPVDSALIYPGYIPRPTDQRASVNLFFQDQMPKWPTFKVNLNLTFGTRLPYGPPNFERYKDTLRSSLYRRVDVGFSKELLADKDRYKDKKLLKHLDDLWLSLEVFNLLNINNTINYLWIKDIWGRQYAVPNFLTSRRINLKLSARF